MVNRGRSRSESRRSESVGVNSTEGKMENQRGRTTGIQEMGERQTEQANFHNNK